MIGNVIQIEPGREHSATKELHVTYEGAVWFLIGVAVVIMRLASLDYAPLTNLEAQRALDSLAIVRGAVITVHDPLYAGLLSVVMSIFGTSAFFVRLISTIAGTWMCLLPIFVRSQMGRSRSLFFAVFLTLSPTFWFVSRQAGGQILAWTLAGTALVAFLQTRQRLSAVLIGLLLACGQDAITPLLIFVGSCLVISMNKEVRAKYTLGITDTLFAIGAFVLASTLLLWRPSGLGDAFNGYAGWPATLITPGSLSLSRVVAGLTVYEPLLLLSTVVSISILVFRQKFNRIDAVWMVWIVAGLLLVIVNLSRETTDILPFIFGTAAIATHVWTETMESITTHRGSLLAAIIVAGISIVMLVYAYLGLSLYAEQQQTASLLSIVLGFIMIIGSGIVCTLLVDGMTSFRGIAAAIGISLCIYTLGAGFQLTQVRATDPAEAYISDATDMGTLNLIKTIESTSLRAYGDASVISIQVIDSAPPALRWALRDQHGASFVSHLSDTAAALTPINIKPDTGGTYVGSTFKITSGATLSEIRCRPSDPGANQISCVPLVRWITQRTVDERLVIRWILWLSRETANRASGIQ